MAECEKCKVCGAVAAMNCSIANCPNVSETLEIAELLDALESIFKKNGEMWISALLKKHGRSGDWAELNGIDTAPEDLVIFCPFCNLQHIDKPEPDRCKNCGHLDMEHPTGMLAKSALRCLEEGGCSCPGFEPWENPPHYKHLCKKHEGGCGEIFIPQGYDWMTNTNGVKELPE